MLRTPLCRCTAGAELTAGEPRVLRCRQEAGQGGAALSVVGVEADTFAGQEARPHGEAAADFRFVGHQVLAFRTALNGVGRAAAIDVLVLNDPRPAEEG